MMTRYGTIHQVWAFPALLSLWVGLLTSSCSLAVDASRVQCRNDADCAAGGPAAAGSVCMDELCQPDPKWACLQQPPPKATSPGLASVKVLALADVVTQQKVSGATLKVCRKLDVDCSSPVTTATSDDTGAATLSVDGSSAGYLEVGAPGYLSTLFFFNPPIAGDRVVPSIPLSTSAAHKAVLQSLGLAPSDNRGTIILATFDCTGKPIADVVYRIANQDPGAKTFYYVDGLPSIAALATTSSGYGGIANVPSGAVTLESTAQKGALKLPSISLVVRGGNLAFSTVVPFGT